AKGMLTPFTVTESTGEAAAAPATDGEIITQEYKFTVPADFSGNGTFEVSNQGEQNHEMAVYQVAEGKTLADVQAYLSSETPPPGPPPVNPAGGISAAAPGSKVLTTLDLSAGDYVMVCFLPDMKSGAPHVALGMVQPFTVS